MVQADRERPRHLHRVRSPQPLIKKRLPTGRGATEQPNATSDGDAELTLKFWIFIVLTGIGAGLFGDLMMVILFNVQHITYHYHIGSFQAAVGRAAPIYRLEMLTLAGAIGGPAWFILSKFTKGEHSEVDDIVWKGEGDLHIRKSLGTSVIQEVVIGMGASLGREAAPKLLGAVSGSYLARWGKLTPAQKRLLIACGAGAGLAAVYNVPLGGALFTAEIMMGEITLPVVLPAILASVVATYTAYLYLPDRATYVGVANYHFHLAQVIFAIVAGPLIGLFSVAFVRLMGMVTHHRFTGRWVLIGPLISFSILGFIGMRYYQLFGNGKDMAHSVFLNQLGSLSLLAALFLLKPIVTALALGTGASGGLFTPTLSTGAVLGGFLGGLWNHVMPGAAIGSYAMIGAAAMMGAGMQAPLAGMVLVLELTHSGLDLIIPLMVATVLATTVARSVDGYSIYSARLAGGGE